MKRLVSVVLSCLVLLQMAGYGQSTIPVTGYGRELHLLQSDPGTETPGPYPPLTLQTVSTERKSAGLAALYSLILPGMGELYADGFSSGKYFLIADGLLWITFAAFEISGNALQDDARAFAVSRAGVDLRGKDDQYFVDVGNFLTMDDYNQKQLRDREVDRLYDPAAGYAWQWDSDASRATYREQRIESDNMFNNNKFVVAALIANRVASAINAVRSVISYNNAIDDAVGDLSFRADVMGGFGNPHGVMLTMRRSF